MNKFMLKMMGLNTLKPINGNLTIDVNGELHEVIFSGGNTLEIKGSHAKKLGDALKTIGVKLTLIGKSEGSRKYSVKEG